MKKIIILILCCGALISMVRCGGNTTPPSTESPPKTASETVITETPTETTPPVTAVEPTLDEIVLEEIRRITYYARTKTNEFVAFISNKSSLENRRELSAKEIELRRKEKRNSDLQALFKRLYEDNVIGKVNNEEFRMLSEEYREEQKAIKEKIPQLQKEIEELKSITVNVEKFISIAKKYTDLQELTPEILRTFISKIVIHERAQK